MVGKQVTFYATSEVYDILKQEAEPNKQSKYINDRILKSHIDSKQPKTEKTPPRSKGQIIGVEIP